MKVVIIGAGLAGRVAYGALHNYKPKVFELAPKMPNNHKAVMRLRDKEVAKLLGVQVREIVVHKSIWDDGVHRDKATISDNNQYSMKLYGEIGNRSLLKSGTRVKRYIFDKPWQPPDDTEWGCNLVQITHRPGDKKGCVLHFERGSRRGRTEKMAIPCDVCITTIPMKATLIAASITYGHSLKFKASPIHVMRRKLMTKSEVNQTVYFPSVDESIYRITIQEQDLIVESTNTISKSKLDSLLYLAFGLNMGEVEWVNEKSYHQPFGKLNSISERIRKDMIFRLTDNYNIYSFGRHAIWKPIRSDDLVEDIEKIHSMMTQGDYEKQNLRT